MGRFDQAGDLGKRRQFSLRNAGDPAKVPGENGAVDRLSIDEIFETAPWLLGQVDCDQRIWEIRHKLEAGTYEVSAEKLATILLRIFRDEEFRAAAVMDCEKTKSRGKSPGRNHRRTML